jgi:hypothetical protein
LFFSKVVLVDSNELLPEKIIQSKPKKQKRQGLSLVSKAKQTKRKVTSEIT